MHRTQMTRRSSSKLSMAERHKLHLRQMWHRASVRGTSPPHNGRRSIPWCGRAKSAGRRSPAPMLPWRCAHHAQIQKRVAWFVATTLPWQATTSHPRPWILSLDRLACLDLQVVLSMLCQILPQSVEVRCPHLLLPVLRTRLPGGCLMTGAWG